MGKTQTTNAETQNNNQKAANAAARTRKKISTEIVKLSDLDVGSEIEGRYLQTTERPWMDKQTGEEKMISQALFERETGERFLVFLDAGAKNALASSGVQKNDFIVLQKLEMKDLGGGRRVNQYDVFQLN